jgi:hypothetical protein
LPVIHRGKNFVDIHRNAKGSPLQFVDMFYTGAPTLPALSENEIRRVFVRDFVNNLDVFTSVTCDGRPLTIVNRSFSIF